MRDAEFAGGVRHQREEGAARQRRPTYSLLGNVAALPHSSRARSTHDEFKMLCNFAKGIMLAGMKPHVRDRLLVGIGLVFILWIGLKIGQHFAPSGGPRRVYDTPVLLEQVQTLSELVTVKYVVEKVEIWDDPPSGWRQFVAGDNRLMLLARGVVKAGVDFRQLKPEDLKVQGKTLWINLPSARVTDAYLDDKETKVIERSTGFLRSFDKDLEQNVRRTAVDDMRTSASRGGIIKDANERARTQLASFFHLMGFERVEFNVSTVVMPNFGGEERGILIISNSIRDTAVPQNQPH